MTVHLVLFPTCQRCGLSQESFFGPADEFSGLGPALRAMRRHGWTVRDHLTLCPHCSRAGKDPMSDLAPTETLPAHAPLSARLAQLEDLVAALPKLEQEVPYLEAHLAELRTRLDQARQARDRLAAFERALAFVESGSSAEGPQVAEVTVPPLPPLEPWEEAQEAVPPVSADPPSEAPPTEGALLADEDPPGEPAAQWLPAKERILRWAREQTGPFTVVACTAATGLAESSGHRYLGQLQREGLIVRVNGAGPGVRALYTASTPEAPAASEADPESDPEPSPPPTSAQSPPRKGGGLPPPRPEPPVVSPPRPGFLFGQRPEEDMAKERQAQLDVQRMAERIDARLDDQEEWTRAELLAGLEDQRSSIFQRAVELLQDRGRLIAQDATSGGVRSVYKRLTHDLPEVAQGALTDDARALRQVLLGRQHETVPQLARLTGLPRVRVRVGLAVLLRRGELRYSAVGSLRLYGLRAAPTQESA